MKKQTFCLLALFILLIETGHSQDSIPTLSGKVNISINNGTMECDFTLSNIPYVKDYYIRLNAGMNILNFESKKPDHILLRYSVSHEEDSLSTGETHGYYFKDYTGKEKYLPDVLRVKYVGKFPVVKDTSDYNYSAVDWKGNIAFNGYSVRADGFQSAWYPYLYDISRDKSYEEMKYDVEVICNDCTTLYLNGNSPTKGTRAQLKSVAPYQLTLYCGAYDFKNVNGTFVLNPDMDDNEIRQLCEVTNSYKKFLEEHLTVPYNQSITYIQTTPTSKFNAWLFVSFPTIANIGFGKYGLRNFVTKDGSDIFKPYIAHELGHYYFGYSQKFNSELGDMMSEGFSEFLSLQITKYLISDSIYRKNLASKIFALSNFDAIPFGKIGSKKDYKNRNMYVYYYAPIIFTAIQKEIGEKTMWDWLKIIIQTRTKFTNYSFLENTLALALKDSKKLELIKSKYFFSENAIENAKAVLSIE